MTSRTIEALTAEAMGMLASGRRNEALIRLRQTAGQPGDDQARYAAGEALLRASECREGWDLYDLHPSRPVDTLPSVARWDGQHCRQLVVVAEQGFGDALQFLRFMPAATAHADNVVFAVHDELLDVLRDAPALAGVTVLSKSAASVLEWPTDARWERLMSLPARLPGLAAAPVEAYIAAPIPRRCGDASQTVVGVAWRSTPRRGFPNRSFPARLCHRLTRLAGVQVVAIQRSRDIRSLPAGVHDPGIVDFTETAQVIAGCDVIVTADTVTAHLAPALGVPTMVCLRREPDWRWGTPTYPTSWYASARLLFQPAPERWSPVLQEAAACIADGTLPTSSFTPPPGAPR
ncbi:hypothetical protein [Pilimelia columellifera]|uniref:Tetratricopeptide repeat protein n=1 Tax=Pilimelia columellifera subsp. columellifera TaxID=706583 RepID=A0ABN3NHM0_9ACTN